MNEIKTVDARGMSCPQPVMLARQAINKQTKGSLQVLVDSGTARDNVWRLARNAGWIVIIEEQPDGSFRIDLKK